MVGQLARINYKWMVKYCSYETINYLPVYNEIPDIHKTDIEFEKIIIDSKIYASIISNTPDKPNPKITFDWSYIFESFEHYKTKMSFQEWMEINFHPPVKRW